MLSHDIPHDSGIDLHTDDAVYRLRLLSLPYLDTLGVYKGARLASVI